MNRVERVRQASKQRRDQEKQELRQMILEAAAQLFIEQGYENFSLRQVAERIGYTATTIYLYFPDGKDQLLFTVVDDAYIRFGQLLAKAADSTTDPIERLVAIGRAYVGFGLSYPAHYELMFIRKSDFLMECREGETTPRLATLSVFTHAVGEAINEDGEGQWPLEIVNQDGRVLKPGEDVLHLSLQEAMEVGAVAPGDIEAVSDFLWSFVHGLVSLSITMPFFDRQRVETALTAGIEIVKAGLKAT